LIKLVGAWLWNYFNRQSFNLHLLTLLFDFPDTPREKGIEEICLATHIWIIRQFGIPRSAAGSPCVSFQHPSHSPGGRSDQIAGPQ
ncbi:hypothetical protein, partial [Pseudomonas lactis]|uniref:hypothetical protein n=1 Tax=Pseudomonas lactis TaxID=1615674 RepID=UPI001CA39BD8